MCPFYNFIYSRTYAISSCRKGRKRRLIRTRKANGLRSAGLTSPHRFHFRTSPRQIPQILAFCSRVNLNLKRKKIERKDYENISDSYNDENFIFLFDPNRAIVLYVRYCYNIFHYEYSITREKNKKLTLDKFFTLVPILYAV